MIYPIIITLLGCAHVETQDIRARNLDNLKRVQVGMSEPEVGRIMGVDAETVQEAVYFQGRLAGYQAIEVRNPYKVENRAVGDKTYRVVYYYADLLGGVRGYWDTAYREAKVADHCLTPLVFENGRLIGWGQAFAEEKNLLPESEMETTDWMLWGR
jgi:hypothetical protein